MILGLGKMVLVYLLILGSGARIVSRLPLHDALGRCLMTLAFGAAQLLLSIQFLSLFRQLTGEGLLLLNAAITAAVFAGTRRWPQARAGGAPLTAARIVSFFKAHPLEGAILALTILAALGNAVIGAFIYPRGDIYHCTTPLFWKQHATILPFPAYDPRLLAVAFGSEAMIFPGFLYARSGVMCAVLAGLAGLMLIWIAVVIAQRLGASPRAAAVAGAMVVGLGPVPVALFGAMADLLLPAMWFGGAVHFLLESRHRETGELQPLELACSVGCLLLACGMKNIVVLQVPSYVAVAALLHGRRLFSRGSVRGVAAAGLAGLLASGVVWSYASNLWWFGDLKGGRELKETVSTEMGPRAMWTRLMRGAITVAFDVIWVPQQHRDAYAKLSVRAVRTLGGLEQLAEDFGFYSFTENGPRPGRGLGPLGIIVFWPAVAATLIGYFTRRRADPAGHRLFPASVALALLTLGSFATCYIVLRWQSIGPTRMMIACLIPGVPLAALWLEKLWARLAVSALLTACVSAYSIIGLGEAIRFLDLKDRHWLAGKIAGLQNDHAARVDYRWQDGPAGSLMKREDYTEREVYHLLFSRIPQPATIGLVGSFNTEGLYFFGAGFSNKVVCLIDSRNPNQLLPPPADVGFIVVDERELRDSEARQFEGFDRWFQAKSSTRPLITVFKRRNTPTP